MSDVQAQLDAEGRAAEEMQGDHRHIVLIASSEVEADIYRWFYPHLLADAEYLPAMVRKIQGLRIHRAFVTDTVIKDGPAMEALCKGMYYDLGVDRWPVYLSISRDMWDSHHYHEFPKTTSRGFAVTVSPFEILPVCEYTSEFWSNCYDEMHRNQTRVDVTHWCASCKTRVRSIG